MVTPCPESHSGLAWCTVVHAQYLQGTFFMFRQHQLLESSLPLFRICLPLSFFLNLTSGGSWPACSFPSSCLLTPSPDSCCSVC